MCLLRSSCFHHLPWLTAFTSVTIACFWIKRFWLCNPLPCALCLGPPPVESSRSLFSLSIVCCCLCLFGMMIPIGTKMQICCYGQQILLVKSVFRTWHSAQLLNARYLQFDPVSKATISSFPGIHRLWSTLCYRTIVWRALFFIFCSIISSLHQNVSLS